MTSRDRLWATIAIWSAVTIILTSFLVKTADWMAQGAATLVLPGILIAPSKITVYEGDNGMVVALVVVVDLVVVAATIATIAVHRSPSEQKPAK